MKLRIELVPDLPEDEIFIRCRKIDDTVQRIQSFLLEEAEQTERLVLYKGREEFHFPAKEILFFETNGESVYAHTVDDAYQVKYRLYELENALSKDFIRVSKSAILNIKHIFSMERNLAASSLVKFQNSYKEVYVSRLYYKELRRRLDERG